jgi:hypothetical protein
MLLAMTRYARTQAVTQGETYRLNYDDKVRQLWLSHDDGSGTQAKPGNEFATPLTLANGVQIDTDIPTATDGQYIEFHPTGRTDPATITLSDKSGAPITIECSSATELFRILGPGETPR